MLNEFEIFQEREKPKETVEPERSREREPGGNQDSLDATEANPDSELQDSSVMNPIDYGQLLSSGYADRY